MAGGSNKHVDEPLERVLVYQGPQTKAMQFYVPLRKSCKTSPFVW